MKQRDFEIAKAIVSAKGLNADRLESHETGVRYSDDVFMVRYTNNFLGKKRIRARHLNADWISDITEQYLEENILEDGDEYWSDETFDMWYSAFEYNAITSILSSVEVDMEEWEDEETYIREEMEEMYSLTEEEYKQVKNRLGYDKERKD